MEKNNFENISLEDARRVVTLAEYFDYEEDLDINLGFEVDSVESLMDLFGVAVRKVCESEMEKAAPGFRAGLVKVEYLYKEIELVNKAKDIYLVMSTQEKVAELLRSVLAGK